MSGNRVRVVSWGCLTAVTALWGAGAWAGVVSSPSNVPSDSTPIGISQPDATSIGGAFLPQDADQSAVGSESVRRVTPRANGTPGKTWNDGEDGLTVLEHAPAPIGALAPSDPIAKPASGDSVVANSAPAVRLAAHDPIVMQRAVELQAVPEPGTLGILSVLGALGLLRRTRRGR